jgi:outer membrane protein TolC
MKKTLFILMIFAAAFAAAEDYSLEDYLARVERFSKDLTLSRQDVEKADVTVSQAWSALLPTVGVQGGYTRNLWDIEQSTPVGVNLPAGPSGFYPLARQEIDSNMDNELSLGVGVEQTIFNMKAIAALRASRQYKNLYGTAYDEAKRLITNAARKAYFGAVLQREVLSVREASEKNAFAVYDDMKKRYEAGMAQELEMLRAEVTWQTSIPEVTRARKNLEIAVVQLKTLAGIDLAESIELVTPLSRYPELPQEISPEESYARRSDYALLLQQKEIAEISIALAEADFYPVISASLNLARQGYGNKAQLMDTHVDVLQLGLRVALPVYTGGARRNQLKIEKLNLGMQDTQLAKKRDDIQAEITGLYLSLKEAWERIESSRMTVETAEKAYRLARVALENGLATQLEVSESATQLEQIQLLYYSSVYEYLSLYFDWEKALGL